MSSVKYFHSAMTGAPTLSGTPGALAAVLDACLVNGFGITGLDSIVVQNGVATASSSLGHPFEADTTALIVGSAVPELNGEFTVTGTTVNTFTFSAPSVVNGTYTGSVTAKLAPAGWEKAFSATNVAAYRSADLTTTRCFLRVDDAGSTTARVVGYEAMSDANTGTGAFPTSAQLSGGYYWPKSTTANSSPTYWVLVGDSKSFWLYNSTTPTLAAQGIAGWLSGFGDLASRKAGDAYGCVIYGAANTSAAFAESNTVGCAYSHAQSSVNTVGYVARSYTAVGSSQPVFNASESFDSGYSGNGSYSYPNGPDNALLLSRMMVCEMSPRIIRGTPRGLLFNPQLLGSSSFTTRDKLVGQGSLAGRTLLALKGSAPAQTSATNITTFLDITGPWE